MVDDKKKDFDALKKSLQVVDLSKEASVRCIPTGVISIDLAVGGGIPEGRFTEIFGEWQSGKSLLMYQAIAECQRRGGVAFLFDSERAFDIRWGKALGIDVDELLLFYPESLEDAFTDMEKAIRLVKSGGLKDRPVLIVYDSLAASVAKDELEQGFGKPEMALRARVISSSLRKMTNLIADHRVALVFVNQLRSKVGVMFGPTSDTTGGRAPKFYATLRLEMSKRNKIKRGDEVIGVQGVLEVVKSKIGVPFRRVNFELFFDKGIDKLSGLLDYFIRYGIIGQSGAWCSFQNKSFRAAQFPQIWEEHSEELMRLYREKLSVPAVSIDLEKIELEKVEVDVDGKDSEE